MVRNPRPPGLDIPPGRRYKRDERPVEGAVGAASPAGGLLGSYYSKARDGELRGVLVARGGPEAEEVHVEVAHDDRVRVLDHRVLDRVSDQVPSTSRGTRPQVDVNDPVDGARLVRMNGQDGVARHEDNALGTVKLAARREGSGNPASLIIAVRVAPARRVIVCAGEEDLAGKEAKLPYRSLGRGEVCLLEANHPTLGEQPLDVGVLFGRAVIGTHEPRDVPSHDQEFTNLAVRGEGLPDSTRGGVLPSAQERVPSGAMRGASIVEAAP